MQPSFLRAGIPYGCLGATVLGGAMTLVIVIGSLIGDCDPGPGCHDQDALVIARELLLAAPIVLAVGAAIGLLAAFAQAALRDRFDRVPLNALLSIATVVSACLSFNGVFALFTWLGTAVGR